jgi:hypothetical protein
MAKLSVYLAGSITAVSKESASSWRKDFIAKWGESFEVHNPLDRDKRYPDYYLDLLSDIL